MLCSGMGEMVPSEPLVLAPVAPMGLCFQAQKVEVQLLRVSRSVVHQLNWSQESSVPFNTQKWKKWKWTSSHFHFLALGGIPWLLESFGAGKTIAPSQNQPKFPSPALYHHSHSSCQNNCAVNRHSSRTNEMNGNNGMIRKQ